jgi:hypothetical protein
VGKEDKKHSKYYYECDRNIDNAKQSSTYPNWENVTPTKKDNRVPDYYKGKEGYEARKVCDNFDLTYHLATATTYILRAYRKHDTPVECLTKAIAHLEFELEKIKREKI